MSYRTSHRVSSYPTGSAPNTSSGAGSQTQSSSIHRTRQQAHLHAQLATLNARLADTENLLRMTAVQAEYIRSLGGYMGSLFMASSKILGEETLAAQAAAAAAAAATAKAERPKTEGNDGDDTIMTSTDTESQR